MNHGDDSSISVVGLPYMPNEIGEPSPCLKIVKHLQIYPNLDIHVSFTKSSKNAEMRGMSPNKRTIPIATIKTPPTFIMIPLYRTIHLVDPRKNVKMIKGNAKPMT